MNIHLGIRLKLSPADATRLGQLQDLFAKACNQLAPLAQQTRCWNRVALHHQAYRQVRDQYPQLGSQMVCNAIYAVSRACRIVYQGEQSPFNIRLRGAAPLPLLRFMPDAPVYFDRHTLTIKQAQASLFTLEGRLHCAVDITPQQLAHLAASKVQEIALYLRDGAYELDFTVGAPAHRVGRHAPQRDTPYMLTRHVQVQDRGPAVAGDPVLPSSQIAS